MPNGSSYFQLRMRGFRTLRPSTAGLTLAKSVIRSNYCHSQSQIGRRQEGDRADAPLELVIRSVDDGHEYREEIIFRVGHDQPIDQQNIEEKIERAIRKASEHTGPTGR